MGPHGCPVPLTVLAVTNDVLCYTKTLNAQKHWLDVSLAVEGLNSWVGKYLEPCRLQFSSSTSHVQVYAYTCKS